jgi:hypothetical protein
MNSLALKIRTLHLGPQPKSCLKKKKKKKAGTLVPRIDVENIMKLGFVLE